MVKGLMRVMCFSLIATSIFSTSSGVHARGGDNILNTHHTEVTAKDDIDLTIEVKENAQAVEGILEYDKDVFHEVSKENLKVLNNWEFLEFNKNNGKFIAVKKLSSEKEEALSVTLKVKEDAKAGDTDVSVQIVTSDGKKDNKSDKSTQRIKIIQMEDVGGGADPSEPDTGEGDGEDSEDGEESEPSEPGEDGDKPSEPGDGEEDNKPSKPDNGGNGDIDKPSEPDNGGGDVDKPDDGDTSKPNNGDTEGSESSKPDSDEGSKDKEDNAFVFDKEETSEIEDKNNVVKEDTNKNYDLLKDMPVAEEDSSVGIVVTVVVGTSTLAGAAYIVLMKYGKGSNLLVKLLKGKSKKYLFLLAGIISLSTSVGVYALGIPSGDVNEDKAVDYLDVTSLERHLIGLKSLPNNVQKNADMNSDGYLTVTDLALIVKKIEGKLDYKVNISSSGLVNYYPSKGDEVEFSFIGDVTYGGVIKKVIIDGEEIDVTPSEGRIYSFNRKVSDVSGVQEFEISHVILDNDKKVKVDYVEKVDILKDKPYIKGYHVEEDGASKKAKVKFTVVDVDSAFTSGFVIVTDKSSKDVLYEDSISVGENEIEVDVDVDDSKAYTVEVRMGYDLDTNTLNDITGEQNNVDIESVLVEEFKVAFDYKMNVSELKIVKEVFEKNEDVVLSFKSTNVTEYYPKTVSVNGNEYSLNKTGDVYSTVLTEENQLGVTTLVVDSIVLNNGKKFDLDDLNVTKELVIKRLKEKPRVVDFTYAEDTKAKKLALSFSLVDNDNTLVGTKLVVLDVTGNSIGEYEVVKGKNEIEVPTNMSAKYVVNVVSEYDLMEGGEFNYKDQTLLAKEIKALPNVEIVNSSISKTSLEKGESAEVTYTFKNNSNVEVSEIQVNSIKHNVTKVSDNVYKINYVASDRSGIYHLDVEKVTLADGSVVYPSNSSEVEVLKDIPTIEDFKTEDLINDSKIKLLFGLKDEDGSFIDGYVTKKGSTDLNSNIIKGENAIDVDVIEGDLYTVEFNVKYNRSYLGNKEETKVVATKEITLVVDYNISVSDLKTSNGTDEKIYFSKGEEVVLLFNSINNTKFIPIEAKVNGATFRVEDFNGKYGVRLGSFSNSGVGTLTIEEITLNNTNTLTISENNTVRAEILKDKPKVIDYAYSEKDDNTTEISFKVVDEDSSFSKGRVKVTDTKGDLIATKDIIEGDNSLSFKMNGSESYSVQVFVDYDLDTDTLGQGDNEYSQELMLDDTVNISSRLLEMKDITNINLYKKDGNNINEIVEIGVSELSNLSDYLVKVNMRDLSPFYTTINSVQEVNGVLKLRLDYQGIVQYTNNGKKNYLEVDFGVVKDGIATNTTLPLLIKKIQENPSGDFELTGDIDASTSEGLFLFTEEFNGTLNGNGYTIRNLSKPLFKKIDDARIENIILENVRLDNVAYRGSVASESVNSTISNIHLRNATISARVADSGLLIGIASANTLIEGISARDVSVTGNSNKRVGGIVGSLAGSKVLNSYLEGTINSNQDGLGGIAGTANNTSTIENIIVSANMFTTRATSYNGGVVGHGVNVVLKNNLSLSDSEKDVANKVYGVTINASSKNNYEILESNLKPSNHASIKAISKDDIDKSFYKDILGLDEDIWDFENDGLPTLRNSDPSYIGNSVDSPKTPNVYIPEYSRISKLSNYDSNKEVAYNNLHKLMPYYDAKYLLVDGEKVDVNSTLNTKLVKAVLPFDENGKLVVALKDSDSSRIKSIKLVYEDDSIEAYDLTYSNKSGRIANYTLNDLGVGYNYDKYLIDTSSKLYTDLVEKIKNIDYRTEVALVTPEEEVRNYYKNFDKVKANAEEFALNLLANAEGYSVYGSNDVLEKLIWNMLSNNKLEKFLYTYNYFDRFYGFEIGNISPRDVLFFDGRLFNLFLNPITVSEEVVTIATEDNRKTEKSDILYNNRLKQYTGKSLGSFLDYFIENFGGDKYKGNPQDWIADNFKGGIAEVGENELGVKYRVWDLMKMREKYILPILSYPFDDLYLYGVPSQLGVGNMRVYYPNNYDSITKEEKDARVMSFAIQPATMYQTVLPILNKETIEVIKTKAHINHDNTYNKNWSQEEVLDPVLEYFYETINVWIIHNYASAFANGTDIFWVYKTLNMYKLWTHENAHNQDGYLFLEGGRRPAGGAEMFTDGFLTQSDSMFENAPNYSHNYPISKDSLINFTTERINSREKIGDFYKKYYQLVNLIDYLEGKAFLELTPKEQSLIARQAEEYSVNDVFYRTRYNELSEDEIINMNLRDMEDLYDNKLVIPRNSGSFKMGSYWYIPNAEKLNETVFMGLATKLMGNFGYDGYVAYAGQKHVSDLDVIRDLMNDENATWKDYQEMVWGEIEDKINNLNPNYIVPSDIIESFKKAYREDIEKGTVLDTHGSMGLLRYNILGRVKRATDDFRTSIYDSSNVGTIEISSADEFISALNGNIFGSFKLVSDIDFTGVTVDGSAFVEEFYGTLDGNGNAITGLSKPLFNRFDFGIVENVTINSANINGTEAMGTIAKTSNQSIFKKIEVNDSTINADRKVGGIVGHAVRSIISESTVNNSSISGTNREIGGISGYIQYTFVTDTHSNGNTIRSAQYNGGFIGIIEDNSYVEKSSSNSITHGIGTGAFTGLLNKNSTIVDSYALGEVVGGSSVSGFVAQMRTSRLERVFSKAFVNSTNVNSGGIIGTLMANTVSDDTIVKDIISVSSLTNGRKFDGNSNLDLVDANYVNTYEINETLGKPSVSDTINKVSVNTITKDFFKNKLNFSEEVWDFSNVEKGGLPKLKNLDMNEVINIIHVTHITSADELLLINNNPLGIFELDNDIDASILTGNDTVVSAVFNGRLEGNGHTITGLRKPLFDKVSGGVVKNIKFEDVEIIRKNTDFVNAIAKESHNGEYTNLAFDGVKLEGRSSVATVVGRDNKDSKYDRISIRNLEIISTGVYNAGIVGRKYGGEIFNSYVEGTLDIRGTDNGGIVGAIQTFVHMKNVISNVDITRTVIEDSRNNNGGLIGNMYAKSTIENCFSLGNMTGTADVGVPKLFGGDNSYLESSFYDNFELSSSTGVSSVPLTTNSHVKEVGIDNLKSNVFYKANLKPTIDTWNFDNAVVYGFPILIGEIHKGIYKSPTSTLPYILDVKNEVEDKDEEKSSTTNTEIIKRKR